MEFKVKILNEEGLHARPAGALAKKAAEFQSQIQVSFNGQMKSAKSVMGLMSLGIKSQDEVSFLIEGPDADSAAKSIQELAEKKFQI